jgi:predicted DsbA family dithiol-disulfide isomerase
MEAAMAVMQFFYDYECPFCKKGYEYYLEFIKLHPEIDVEWRPVEAHPRPEEHSPHTDLACQSYYIAKELGVNTDRFHAALFQAVAVERRNVEDPAVLAGIVKDLVDPVKFRAILDTDKYRVRITENNNLAYEKNGIWFLPAFRMNGKKLDAQGGIGVSREAVRNFLNG